MRPPRAEPEAPARRPDGRLGIVLACQVILSLFFFSPHGFLSAFTSAEPIITGRYPGEIASMVRRPRWVAEQAVGLLPLAGMQRRAPDNTWTDETAMQWQKLRLFAALALLPIIPAFWMRNLGASTLGQLLSSAVTILVCWSATFRPLIAAGYVEPLVQVLCGAALVGMSVRPISSSLASFALLSVIGTWLDPLGWLAIVPVLVVCDAIRWVRNHSTDCLVRSGLALCPVMLEGFAILMQSSFRWHEIAVEVSFQIATGRLLERLAAPLLGATIGLFGCAMNSLARRTRPWNPISLARFSGGLLVVAGSWLFGEPTIFCIATSDWGPSTITTRLSASERVWTDRFKAATDERARVLWERGSTDPSWLPYLSQWTGRRVLASHSRPNSLEPVVECDNGDWEGRPIAEWTDRDLAAVTTRLNIGWIRCDHPDTKKRLQSFAMAKPIDLGNAVPGVWFQIDRPGATVIRGRAEIVGQSARELVLVDVVPEQGVVVLSLARPVRCQAAPTLVTVEDDPDPLGGPNLMRLRTAGPVSRVTLRW